MDAEQKAKADQVIYEAQVDQAGELGNFVPKAMISINGAAFVGLVALTRLQFTEIAAANTWAVAFLFLSMLFSSLAPSVQLPFLRHRNSS